MASPFNYINTFDCRSEVGVKTGFNRAVDSIKHLKYAFQALFLDQLGFKRDEKPRTNSFYLTGAGSDCYQVSVI